MRGASKVAIMFEEADRNALLDLTAREATVLVIDVVESMRLMETDEPGVIQRWRDVVREAATTIVPRHDGHLVKSLGDGLMMTFNSPRSAVAAATGLHDFVARGNARHPETPAMSLRAGIHCARLYEDDLDIYGTGVNLAARLASLSAPGGTVVSLEARDRLVAGLDVDLQELEIGFQDLGTCFPKHVEHGVRAYRVHPPGQPSSLPPPENLDSLRPTVAVIPFDTHGAEGTGGVAGEWIGNGIIAGLSRARHLKVISHLSMSAFAGRPVDLQQISSTLRATYLLAGRSVSSGRTLAASWELTDLRSNEVIDAGRFSVPLSDLFDVDGEGVRLIVQATHAAILRSELAHARSRPMPTLESYALLLGGIQLLHRSSGSDFARSFKLLEYLAERHPRAVEPRIWLAKWYALRAVQGGAAFPQADTQRALDLTRCALDEDPSNALALAMTGFVHCHLTHDYDAARNHLDASVAENPSEAMGHLFSAVVDGLEGRFDAALASFDMAHAMSPLDPASYLFDSIGAYAHLGAGHLDDSIKLALRSLRSNLHHAHTWRVLTIALAESGRLEEARTSLAQLQKVQHSLTERSYLASGRPGDATRRRFADALLLAGLPRS
jgi:adenylate cyclase